MEVSDQALVGSRPDGPYLNVSVYLDSDSGIVVPLYLPVELGDGVDTQKTLEQMNREGVKELANLFNKGVFRKEDGVLTIIPGRRIWKIELSV